MNALPGSVRRRLWLNPAGGGTTATTRIAVCSLCPVSSMGLFLHNWEEHHRHRELTLPGSEFKAWTLSPSGSELVLFPVVYEEIPGGGSRLSRG